VGTGKAVAVNGIGISGPDAGNYSVNTSAVSSASITKASLTVAADNQSRPYGQANPVLTIRYFGFVGGDDVDDLDSLPVASTTATSVSLVGDYPITLTGGVDGDYSFNFVNGTLTVTTVPPVILSLTRASPGTMVITWRAIPNQTYRLLQTDDLRSMNWVNPLSDVIATGETAAATNVIIGATQRFYRVLLLTD
jgi:hypothetical protein